MKATANYGCTTCTFIEDDETSAATTYIQMCFQNQTGGVTHSLTKVCDRFQKAISVFDIGNCMKKAGSLHKQMR